MFTTVIETVSQIDVPTSAKKLKNSLIDMLSSRLGMPINFIAKLPSKVVKSLPICVKINMFLPLI